MTPAAASTREPAGILATLERRKPQAPPAAPHSPLFWAGIGLAMLAVGGGGYWLGRQQPAAALAALPLPTDPAETSAQISEPETLASAAIVPAAEPAQVVDTPPMPTAPDAALNRALEEHTAAPSAQVLTEALAAPAEATQPVAVASAAAVATAAVAKPSASPATAPKPKSKPKAAGKPVAKTSKLKTAPAKAAPKSSKPAVKAAAKTEAKPKSAPAKSKAQSEDSDVNILNAIVEHVNRTEKAKPATGK